MPFNVSQRLSQHLLVGHSPFSAAHSHRLFLIALETKSAPTTLATQNEDKSILGPAGGCVFAFHTLQLQEASGCPTLLLLGR